MTPEGRVVADIKAAMKELGCEVRKCQWVGHAGAPDLFIMLPDKRRGMDKGRHFWVEVKAPEKEPEAHQLREHMLMERSNCLVYVDDNVLSTIEHVKNQSWGKALYDKAVQAEVLWKQRLARREARNARGKKDTV